MLLSFWSSIAPSLLLSSVTGDLAGDYGIEGGFLAGEFGILSAKEDASTSLA